MAKTLGQLATEVLNKKYEKPIEGIPKGDLAETYIKSTDYATAEKAGVVQIDPNYSALYQWQHPVTHDTLLMLNGANTATIKAGNSITNPIMVGRQHEAVFYGLAKAAGDTTQSSSDNAVGTYTDAAKTAIRTMLGVAATTDVTVSDVQINGTSAVSNGTANIPLASSSTPGVIYTNNIKYGLWYQDGKIFIAPAAEADIKAGTSNYTPIVPGRQEISVFYGLAKAAGDSTQSNSDNAVGTYTDNAKSAIRSMLGAAAATDITVSDVQVNGTSVLSNGVANVPVASSSLLGVVKGNNYIAVANDGGLTVTPASTNDIKNGTNFYELVPARQHTSTFYGLAKAAGDTTQSTSSNAIGLYTDNAKAAIQGMLDVPSNDDLTFIPQETILEESAVSGTTIVSFNLATPAQPGTYKLSFDNVVSSDTDKQNSTIRLEDENGTGVQACLFPRNQRFQEYFTINTAFSKIHLYASESYNSSLNDTFTYTNVSLKLVQPLVEAINNTVKDVQVNGTSIVNNSVATIPAATKTSFGLVKIRGALVPGSEISTADPDGIYINSTTVAGCKTGTNQNFAVTPSVEHAAAFYGLAKAAGDTTQSASSNAVGTYTDNAKVAIRTMLGATSSNIIAVQSTQPTDADTKIWIPDDTADNVQVPTMADMETALAGKVSDVKVNGSSVVSDGVASIATAHDARYGVVKSGRATEVQAGASSNIVVSTYNQHYAAFYGLSKAAGVDLANETVTLGTYPDTAKTAIRTMLGAIGDVQVDGATIASNGVANIPIANSTTPGIMKVTTGGLGLVINADKVLQISPADSATIKTGTQGYRPVVPLRQHEAIFFGLSKLAGVDLANETVTVGTYSDTAKTAIRSMLGAIGNTDYATTNTGGVVKVGDGSNGIGMINGQIYIQRANSGDIKAGTSNYKSIVPNYLHEAVFYGLAKAAGDTTQSASSNAVGTYTAEAKAAIHTMLDIDNSIVEQYISSAAPTITAMTNCRYICGEITSLDFTPCATGTCEIIFTAGSTLPVVTLPSTVKMPEWYIIETNTIYDIIITNGVYGTVMSWAL